MKLAESVLLKPAVKAVMEAFLGTDVGSSAMSKCQMREETTMPRREEADGKEEMMVFTH